MKASIRPIHTDFDLRNGFYCHQKQLSFQHRGSRGAERTAARYTIFTRVTNDRSTTKTTLNGQKTISCLHDEYSCSIVVVLI